MYSDLEKRTVNKVFWRLIPYSTLLFVIAFIDRANVSFAALQMNQDLKFSPAVYGFGAGIFFIGYAFFEVPSNLVLARVGARRWIARIMITWGIVAAAMAFVYDEWSFYILRFLLGVAEAGFLPGMIYYFGNWIPRNERAKMLGVFLSGVAIGSIVGGPLAGALLSLDGLFGLRGWQVLFIAEGMPAVLIGFLTIYFLTEKPQDAKWLTAEEKGALINLLEKEDAELHGQRSSSFTEVFFNASVWKLIGFVFFMSCANYGIVLWLPQIIKQFSSLSSAQIGLLAALPFIIATAFMIYWGRHSDLANERKWHLVSAVSLGGIGLAASAIAPTALLQFVGVCIGAVGLYGTFGVFWAMPSDYLKGVAAASGLAFINSIGITGGFFGPYIVGFVRGQTESFSAALLVLACCAGIAALFGASLRKARTESEVRIQPAT